MSRLPHGASDMRPVFVGRQPIFDANAEIAAFELLFRAGHTDSAEINDADWATTELLRTAFVDIGVENLVGDRLAFINLSPRFIGREVIAALPAERTVLELPATSEIGPQTLAGIRLLREQGFRIALRCPDTRIPPAHVLASIDLVKLDARACTAQQLETQYARLSAHARPLVAEKIEDEATLARCRRLGFDYFQGFYLSYPNVVEGQRLAGAALALVRLIELLQRPDASVTEISRTITSDAALSLEILRLANSPRFRRQEPVESIEHALFVLGRTTIRHWALLLMLRRTPGSPVAIEQILIRARMGELLAPVLAPGNEAQRYFTLGLLSALERFLGIALEDIVEQMRLGAELRTALLNHEGSMGLALEIIEGFEQPDARPPDDLVVSAGWLSTRYLQAIDWARETLDALR
ncbi:EAL and HDOD domain-containing protein [Marichromatium bheemlicum]|uniref:HDOD domain-containing protein n=1 Tax=Marichromatium bheemlicum TaxID=365339 RepID=A0ABX1I4N3_9GAMM|nr:HDOD domain-containing protein [Marichromatium bheemlicum]NKN31949.1 HDOD domain-containing protein [Marichromatium bheemlicum]